VEKNVSLEENISNRAWLAARIRAEVVGPDPTGEPIIPPCIDNLPDCTWSEFRTPRRQQNGEEVLWQDPPSKRYGAGILFPAGSHIENSINTGNLEESLEPVYKNPNDAVTNAEEKSLSRDINEPDDTEDYGVSLANAMSPSAIGLSFFADLSTEAKIIVIELINSYRTSPNDLHETPSATYRCAKVMVRNDNEQGIEKNIWLREPLLNKDGSIPKIEISINEIKKQKTVVLSPKPVPGIDNLFLIIVSRPWKYGINQNALWLLTASFVNKNNNVGNSIYGGLIVQAGIRVSSKPKAHWIAPYPKIEKDQTTSSNDSLSDIKINQILYRKYQTYAIGHGCSADWSTVISDRVSSIWSDVLPSYETPSTTAELEFTDDSGEIINLKISMRKLAGLDHADSGQSEIDLLVSEYERWIKTLRSDELPRIQQTWRETGEGLIDRCEQCLDRIRDGISLLKSDEAIGQQVRQAFRFANHAMLIAQLRGGTHVRIPSYSLGKPNWNRPAESPDPAQPDNTKGYWRPFQIAFLLMSMRGICDPKHDSRSVVDLIWFPTGGGKTEAYLGVTAFTIFFNRLSGRVTEGCDVLMRYTLRLLTAQQFQRAATLFCAMEHLRSRNESELGTERFTLGLWVGSGTTPNKREDAIEALKKLNKGNLNADNPFVLLQCPWCGARMGPLEMSSIKTKHPRNRGTRSSTHQPPSVIGYIIDNARKTVVYQCPDSSCEFGNRAKSVLSRTEHTLPIATIDEDLVENPPRLLIGTVDKFAQLAWKPELRRLFGIDKSGQHSSFPPTLIIQDELHLISGPLGTMVGAFETVIDRLCREHGLGNIGPKIIASTATISRSLDQVKNLYARRNMMLFPPSGLSSSDSFFARETDKPGRMYLGVMAPAHYSIQTTETRIFSTLLQNVEKMPTDDEGKDPWWTLLCFFNSLRELGSASTLMIADVREYIRVLMDRYNWDYRSMRNSMAAELTSRIRGDEIPKELAKLEIPLSAKAMPKQNGYPVDVCLASNIIEVGIDLPRLSLMTIVGQPKSTSQYIQVSSRVGRGKDKPGLVVVLYGQSKPRDRSHYEHFRSYHQMLYAQVEPTSITPFSTPAIERVIQSIIITAIRQLGKIEHEGKTPRPFPLKNDNILAMLIEDMFRERCDIVTDGHETEAVIALLQKRLREWQVWDPAEYGKFGSFPESPPLMYPAGACPPSEWNNRSWPVLSSLRNVDASGEAEITDWFNATPQAGEQQ